jgi:hypothetical protein
MVGGVVQDTLLCLIVGEVVVIRPVFHNIIVEFSEPSQ